MKLKTMLEDEIVDEFNELNKQEVGTDKYKNTVDGITKLVDRALEFEKLEKERYEKELDRDINVKIQNERLKIENLDKFIGHALNIASIAATITVTIWGTLVTLKFEETGTVTTAAGKNFISRLFLKK